jgi:tRNA nucleotidyltransferase (CCA-adding enzyme)
LVKDLEDQDFLLLLLDFADRQSREANPMDVRDIDDICKWYLQKKEEYKINQETIQPIIMGRDLLELGVSPGVRMGVYLRELYERQLDGEFDTKEEGLKVFEKIRERQ